MLELSKEERRWTRSPLRMPTGSSRSGLTPTRTCTTLAWRSTDSADASGARAYRRRGSGLLRRTLVAWVEGFGVLGRVGVEGSGSFGLGLARFLRTSRGVGVVEVNRPNRQHRRAGSVSTTRPRTPRPPPERCRPTRRGHRRAQVRRRRRRGGDDACPARRTPLRAEGAHPGRQPTASAAVHGPGGAEGGGATRAPDEPAGDPVAARFRPGRCPRNLVGATKKPAMRSIARRHRASRKRSPPWTSVSNGWRPKQHTGAAGRAQGCGHRHTAVSLC